MIGPNKNRTQYDIPSYILNIIRSYPYLHNTKVCIIDVIFPPTDDVKSVAIRSDGLFNNAQI